MRALAHTSATFVNLVTYALTKLNVIYIMLGKIQTDNLEKRFGEHRQLCGGNYHVSVQQVLEVEKTLLISSLLYLSSSKHGHIAVRDTRETLINSNSSMTLTVIIAVN